MSGKLGKEITLEMQIKKSNKRKTSMGNRTIDGAINDLCWVWP